MINKLTENKLKKVQLSDIKQRKLEVRNEISLQKDVISYSAKRIISPFSSNGKSSGNGIVKKFNTGLAIFDGVMIGYKMIKGIKKAFRRR
ncbi:hypothetical protein LJC72_05575 [Bacteroides sp. OttesenSCG-928-D19]|nr:hypothetical protein [Bacteroides sp. OttesenSCG-928-N06]MDL2304795.1 hypothetical protein [Bacteroides sp. OttesenSCG-928-D19]